MQAALAPTRSPGWISTRRMIERTLADLHNCKELRHLKRFLAIAFKFDLLRDNVVGTKLVSAFSHCRQMVPALYIFSRIQDPDALAYNVLIRAHVGNSDPLRALQTFSQMQNEGVRPNVFTCPFVLKAGLGLELVAVLHGMIEKYGFSEDVFAPNSLIEAYSRCGSVGVSVARKVFEEMLHRDNISWNCMISGLVRTGELQDTRKLFDEMPERDIVSWNTMLDGYVKSGKLNEASELFETMPAMDSVSWSTMVLGYSRAGYMGKARHLYDKMPVKNMVAWTILVSAYAEKGFAKEAMRLYGEMVVGRVGKPDEGSIVSILGACAESGMLGLGKKVHDFVKTSRYDCSIRVCNALVNMYSKCGRVDDALITFDGMKERNAVSWSTMIHGLGMHGFGQQALQLFSRMIREGFVPNNVTFIGVLSACSHAGLVDAGVGYFDAMQRDYGIIPEITHYGCMIDLLGRGGRLREAFRLVLNMPMKPNQVIWGALLAACRKHDFVTIGGEEFQKLVEHLSEKGNLSLLSDIHAAAGDWSGVASARSSMRNASLGKAKGTSSIELDNEYHHFTMMDTRHLESYRLYEILGVLNQHMAKFGEVPLAQ